MNDPLTVARSVAGRILTLPIYSELGVDDVERICDIIRDIRSHAAHHERTIAGRTEAS